MFKLVFILMMVCLFALGSAPSQSADPAYTVYYVEADYSGAMPYNALYKMNMGDEEPQLLFENAGQITLEDVSAQNDWLLVSAFDSNTGIQDIYRMTISSDYRQNLTRDEAYNSCARITDDGRAFVYESSAGGFELRRQGVDGEDQFITQSYLSGMCSNYAMHGDWLVQVEGVNGFGRIVRTKLNGTERLVLSDQDEATPRISPDAQWVASRDAEGVVLRSIDGTSVQHIPDSDGSEGQFYFTADSQALILQYFDETTETYELKRVELSDLTSQVLTGNMPGDAWLPNFLPDAEWFVFMVIFNDNADVYRMDMDGKNTLYLANERENEWAMAISPDNAGLVFSWAVSETQTDLFWITIDGKVTTRLTASPLEKTQVLIVPEGSPQ